ncbi:MAG TPA: NAD(P)-dependent oxidoreductase [Gemmatimonadales bacterium]|nr:NAD(P)-dependent oxidoreductase [Gemmatimonadales bacterium]
MEKIAFLGTGLLGSGFVEAAAGRGSDVTAWNRTDSKARALEHLGVRIASTPAEAVRGAKFVHLVLKDDEAVEDVIALLRRNLEPGAVIIDHTTTLPEPTAERSARLAREGVNYLHCPVFIGPAAARESEGTILASGRRDLFDSVKNHLESMATRVEFLGERPDLAAIHKLCGNTLIVGITALVADVMAVATGSGLPASEALRCTEFFNPAGTIKGRGGRMARREYAPTFEMTMARKDIQLMIEAAGDVPLATLPGIAERMDTLIAAGHGHEDMSAIGRESVG